MINQLRADWYRQWHTLEFYLVVIFSAFYGAFATWQHILSGLIVNAPEKLMNQLIDKHWSVLDTLHAVTISSSFLLYIFIALVVILVGYEFSQHTYKNSLITGISRLQFVLSKYLMLLIDLCLCMVLFYGSAVVYALLQGARLGTSVGTLWRQGLLLGGTITFFMSVVFALAILVLLASGSLVICTVFAVVWPLFISLINSFVDWHWLTYLDFLSSSMKITLGLISSSDQWRYLGVSVGLLVFAILGATVLIQRREL